MIIDEDGTTFIKELIYRGLLKPSHRNIHRRDILPPNFVGLRPGRFAGLVYYQAVEQIWIDTVHLVPPSLFSGTGGDMYRNRELFYYSSIEEKQWGDV